jgi:hypothetical protein
MNGDWKQILVMNHVATELFWSLQMWVNNLRWFFLTTNKFQLPSNIFQSLDGNWNVLVIERGGGLCYDFGKLFFSSFTFPLGWPKNIGHHLMVWVCWMVTKILWSPSDTPSQFDVDKNSSITTKGGDRIFLITHPCAIENF